MPLSPSVPRRALRHTRTIQVEAYAREDGLWDVDAHLVDVKTRDVPLASGLRAAGSPVHSLWLRLTINTEFDVVAAEAVSDAVPYPGYCDTVGAAYQKLVGLNLAKGFRAGVREKLGGIQGCTHLTELSQLLPTAAIQAMGGEALARQAASPGASPQRPYQLDRCHALRTGGPAVAKYYPRWAIQPAEDI